MSLSQVIQLDVSRSKGDAAVSSNAEREVEPDTSGAAALEADVELLAGLLVGVLREQEGPLLVGLLDEVMALARRARLADRTASEALRAQLAALESAQALAVSRALAHLLALANIAEQHHRVRARRIAARAPDATSTTEATLAACLANGAAKGALYDTVCALRVELVLTAHPTQAMRRTLLQKHRRVAALLARRERSDLPRLEREEIHADLKREIIALWQTDELRRRKPTPIEEARAGLVLFDQVLWDAVPSYLRELSRSLVAATGRELPMHVAPLCFGSWMGGDRDGNPNVTAEVTAHVCLLARWQAAELYYREIEKLHDELSMTHGSAELLERAKRMSTSHEPYRVILREVLSRLVATRTLTERQLQITRDEIDPHLRGSDRPGRDLPNAEPYGDPRELWEPLALCHRSLCAVGAGSVAEGRLLDVLRRVAAFGISLSRLDIRQESSVHARALDAITQALDLGSYLAWSEDERIELLVRELSSKRPLLPRKLPDSPELIEALATLQAMARQPESCRGAYVISMARSASDVLAVCLLQREAGVVPAMRVVPLFETLADLQNAGAVMKRLLDIGWYREHIAGKQEVMIGYSDSTKDAGRMAGAWGLFCAQEQLVALCAEHAIELTLFHGRGGTIGRGGGPIHLAILSQPPGSVSGRLRVTIQGETMDGFFGLPEVAVESFEHYVNATLTTTLEPPAPPTEEQRALMDRLAALAANAYRRVIERDATFIPYFQAATPERELGRLNIGSRPARRKATQDIGSLRAIPWTFAWTQTRLHLPAWLGTGEALTTLFEEGMEPAIRDLTRELPFFRSLMDLLAMVLSKADPEIAAYYDRVLVPDELRPLGQELRASCERTIAAILRAREDSSLLARDPELRRTLALRHCYVDPLNLLQAELLRRNRAGEDATIANALLVTINGIAAGMRNTG
jgi:phosphoenolpyruvate carboxylase